MNTHEEQITRWTDGEPAPAALSDADLAAIESARRLGDALRENYAAELEVSGPDFFMHQLDHRLDRLAEEQAVAAPAMRRLWWLARGSLAAAAAVVLGVLGWQWLGAPQAAAGGLISTFSPDSSLTVNAHYESSADAVVIVIDGLEPFASAADVVGYLGDAPAIAAGPRRPAPVREAGLLVKSKAINTHTPRGTPEA